jgi:hypothetical protein
VLVTMRLDSQGNFNQVNRLSRNPNPDSPRLWFDSNPLPVLCRQEGKHKVAGFTPGVLNV